MKGAGKILVAGTMLFAVLLAGMAAAQEGGIEFSKSGDIVTITGHTNLATGDRLLINVVSVGFTPTEKGTGGGFSGAAGTVVVQQGSPMNVYTFDVNVSTFPRGDYLVTVESMETGFRDSAHFTLPFAPVPTGTPVTPSPTFPRIVPPSTPPPTVVPFTSSPPTPAPLSWIMSIGALGLAVSILVLRR